MAFLIALPVVLYQAWAYIAPALYRSEKLHRIPDLDFLDRHVCDWYGLLLLHRLSDGLSVHRWLLA